MCCLFLAASSTVAIAQTSVVDLANPIIGTNGMGHTFPGACVPFGLVQLSPDTDTIPHNVDGKYQPRSYEYCAGYQHKDSSIVGFSHTHFSGTGHSDLGDILIMPTTGTFPFLAWHRDIPSRILRGDAHRLWRKGTTDHHPTGRHPQIHIPYEQ